MSNLKVINNSYLKNTDFIEHNVTAFVKDFLRVSGGVKNDRRYFFMGNGASAAICSHLANDFSKALEVKATTFHDPAQITCLANDYGYENWLKEAIKLHCEMDDVIVLVSSSGTSKIS